MKKLFVLIITLTSLYCFAQEKEVFSSLDTLSVKMSDFGKCSYLPEEFYSKADVLKKDITSAVYVGNNVDGFDFYPIDNKYFNYEYFQSSTGSEYNIQVKIIGRKILVKNKEYFLVHKIVSE